jgi:hypothetical protein
MEPRSAAPDAATYFFFRELALSDLLSDFSEEPLFDSLFPEELSPDLEDPESPELSLLELSPLEPSFLDPSFAPSLAPSVDGSLAADPFPA